MAKDSNEVPLILEPQQLEQMVNQENTVIVDLSKAENYQKYHIPNAVWLNYADIVRVRTPDFRHAT